MPNWDQESRGSIPQYNSQTKPKTPATPATPTTPAPTPVDPNAWAYKPPTDIQTLLRQLSANVGQEFMPYGPGGDVRQPAFGQTGAPQMNVNPATYGETGGETNFFQTTTKGGMAPISSVPRTVTPWDPLKIFGTVAAAPATNNKKTDDDDDDEAPTPLVAAPPPTAGMTPEQLMMLINTIFPTQ